MRPVPTSHVRGGMPVRPLRILHIIAQGNLAGTEMSATLLAKGQAARGLRPTIGLLYSGGPIETVLEHSGIPAVHVGARHGRDPRVWRRLINLIRSIRPDILHVHDLRLWSCVLGRAFHRGPHILTIHHQMIVGADAWRWRLNYRVARWAYDSFTAVSDAALTSITEAVRLPRDRCTVIPNAIPVDAFRPEGSRSARKKKYGNDPDEPIIGFVGRLNPEKGVDDFLKTCREILHLEPRARFWIIGDGEEAGTYMSLAGTLGLGARVTFWGHRLDVADMLGAMDVLLMTSRREAFGMVLLEAMAAEVPVLGFVPLEGGVLEVIRVPETALLLPERDPVRLATLVVEILRSPEERDRLTTAAVDQVRRNFDLDDVTERYLELYLQLLKRRGALGA